jgi:uncharacterized Zn-binding protein involved in type VI secretion
MGRPAARLHDLGSGHMCYPPHDVIKASENVIINGQGAARDGDELNKHCCLIDCHDKGTIKATSSTVLINGMKAGRIGDRVTCGGAMMTGSSNVLIGD